MTETFDTNEFLSAFLDGELSPTDRVQAQRWLDEDVAAREKLQRLGEVGSLLQSLPERTLADGFRAEVMHRCERDTLLCEDSRSTRSHSETTEPRSARSRGALIGSVLATAAMLFLALRVATTSSEHVPEKSSPSLVADDSSKALENQDAVALNAPQKNGDNDKNGDGIAAGKLRRRSNAQSVATGKGKVSTESAFKKSAGLNSPSGVSRLPMRSGFGGGQGAAARGLTFNRATSGGVGGFAGDESLRDRLRIGDVIPYLAISGSRTAVVEVTVVDIRPAVDKLEVLLIENEVRSALPTKKEREKKSGSKAAKTFDPRRLKLGKDQGKSDDGGRLLAVYVELTQSQLADVMRQVGRKTGSLRVSLKPPVEFRDVPLAAPQPLLASGLRKQLGTKLTLADAVRFARDSVRGKAPAEADKSQTDTPRTKGKRKLTKAAPGNAANSKRPARDPKSNAESAPQDGKPAASPVGRSFHLRLNLDVRINPLAKPRAAATESSGRRAPRQKPLRQFRVQTTASRAAPVRVIFVFRKPAQSPAGKPKH